MADSDSDNTNDQTSDSNSSEDLDFSVEKKSSFDIDGTIVEKTELKRLVKSSALEDVNRLNELVVKILEVEKYSDNYKAFKYLMNQGYKLDVLNSKGQTAVHVGFLEESNFIHYRHVRDSLYDCYDEFDTGEIISELVHKWLLKKSVNLKHIDSNGLTYLHIACFLNHSDYMEKKNLIDECLKNKSDVNAQFNDPEGRYKNFTPLHFAVINSSENSADIVHKLLVPGIKLDAKDFLGRTQLHLACLLYKDPDDVYKFNDSFDKFENDSTMAPRIFKESQDYYMNSLDIIDLLVTCGANVNMKDKNGNTPLLSIFPDNYKEFVRFKYDWLDDEIPIIETTMKFACLLKHGAKVNLKNKSGDTILHLILRNLKAYRKSLNWNKFVFNDQSDQYHFEMIKNILNSKQIINVNAKNKKGETPIQWAVQLLSVDAVQLLLNHGANFKHLKFDSADGEKFFFHPNTVPNFEVTQNLITITEILQSKSYNLTLEIKIKILNFLIHNVNKCECNDICLSFFYGSKSHFKHLLSKKYLFSFDKISRFLSYCHTFSAIGLYIDKELQREMKKIMRKNNIKINKSSDITETEAEIILMKSIKVSDNLNLHDLLTRHLHNLPYTIVKNFDYKVLKDLEYYEDYVKSHFTKRILRRFVEKMCDGSVKKLCCSLPDLCCQLIVDYLNNEDIVNVYSIVNSVI